MCLADYAEGKDLCIDFTVVSSLNSEKKGAEEVGYHAQEAFIRKNNKYLDLCRNNNLLFQPFVMESFGGMHNCCDDLTRRISRALAVVSGLAAGFWNHRIRQSLVFTLIRHNSLTILGMEKDISF